MGDSIKKQKARHILGSLNLSKIHHKIDTLSIGERSKTALAKIFLHGYNVLLLD